MQYLECAWPFAVHIHDRADHFKSVQYYTGKNLEILEQIKGLALDVLTKVYAAYPLK
jgi:hypothetical protein